jgi:hypothetical protein
MPIVYPTTRRARPMTQVSIIPCEYTPPVQIKNVLFLFVMIGPPILGAAMMAFPHLRF